MDATEGNIDATRLHELKTKNVELTLHLKRRAVSGVDRSNAPAEEVTVYDTMTVAEAKIWCARNHQFAPSRFQIWDLPDDTVLTKDEHDGKPIEVGGAT